MFSETHRHHSGPATRGRSPVRSPWRWWAAIAAVFVTFAFVFFGTDASFAIPTVEAACGQAPPDVRFSSSADEVHRFLEACGPSGRAAYTRMQVADLAYPAVFGAFIAASLWLVLRRRVADRPALVALLALPVLGTGFDYLENALAWRALAAFPDPSATDGLLGLASAAKTTSFWMAGVVLLGAAALLALGSLHRRLRSRGHRVSADLAVEAR